MPRSDLALPLRVPSALRARVDEDDARPPEDDRPRLRLVVTRGRLGAELEQPYSLGIVDVQELSLSFPNVRFPVELSGGLASFRHRRGQLDRLSVAVDSTRLSRWAPPLLRGLLGAEITPSCVVVPTGDEGLLIGLCSGDSALAFELLLVPLDDDVRLLITEARGLGLSAPPQLLAARAVAALLKPLGGLAGGVGCLDRIGRLVARALLPLAGMRVPSCAGLLFRTVLDVGRLGLSGELVAGGDAPPSPPRSPRVIRALELCELLAEAEQAALSSEPDSARDLLLRALERAPRHPEIARRIAEIDLAHGGRAEAALAIVSEAMPVLESGVLGGLLLGQVGDVDGAVACLQRAAELEPYGPLAALSLVRIAQLAGERRAVLEALDEAVARGPSQPRVRWRRFCERCRQGDLRGALQDAKSLEAAAAGPHDRHEALRRCAEHLLELRHDEAASELFNRALQYRPQSAAAVAGLAESLQSLGQRQRALELFGRARALADAQGLAAHDLTLRLAQALVEVADDRPAGIARVRRVPSFIAQTFEARLLEARWRAELGDLAGSSQALARLRDAVEQALELLVREPHEGPAASPFPSELWGDGRRWRSQVDARAEIAALLAEGAAIEELGRGDRRAAQALLALALRLQPGSPSIAAAFRRVAAACARRQISSPEEPAPAPETAAEPSGAAQRDVPEAPATLRPADGSAPTAPLAGSSPADEQLVEQLTAQLCAQPGDSQTVRRLAAALECLGRDHELLALLSAHLDETEDAPLRAELRELRRQVLRRLLVLSQAAGNHQEAELYALMLAEE